MFNNKDNMGDEFGKPVESIMQCENFKSNFARKLSNRFISRPSLPILRQDSARVQPPVKNAGTVSSVQEKSGSCSQLLKNSSTKPNGEPPQSTEKKTTNTDALLKRTEMNLLNMEVETLRWQLAQTEANRQMHIALLKQIVSFLNRVKEHIEIEKNDPETRKNTVPSRKLPNSFNTADLPRSLSVVHVNKNPEYQMSSPNKMSTRKISKSISNVNGFRDIGGVWSHSQSQTPEKETKQKMTEEITRLITLAGTVLSTKLPDLACTCNDNANTQNESVELNNDEEVLIKNVPNHRIEDDGENTFVLSTICSNADEFSSVTNKFVEAKIDDIGSLLTSSPPLENFSNLELVDEQKSPVKTKPIHKAMKTSIVKINDYTNASNFIEDESGFSSMSSFQEIGIPIISIIPPSPCKEVGYNDDYTDVILDETGKWKSNLLELDKQNVKVFWV